MKQFAYIIIGLCMAGPVLYAQSYRALIDDGNEDYSQKEYDKAETQYKESIREKPERIQGHFNLGNAAYRKSDIQAALDAYKNAATKAKSKSEVAQTLYNVGNTYLKAAEAAVENAQQMQQAGDLQKKGYQQAIEAYKQALKLNPKDADSRYNLVYAMNKLKDLQNQNQNKDQNKDQKQDQKKDQKDKDDKEKNKDQQQDQQKKDEQNKEQNQDQQKQDKKDQSQQQKQPSKPQEQKMSKEQAEQILKALEQDEKNLQKKVRAKRGSRVRVEKDW